MSLYENELNLRRMRENVRDFLRSTKFDYTSMNNLAKVNNFWEKSKWYLVGLLFFVVLIAYYKGKNMGTINMAVIIILVFLFVIILIVFNDRRGLVGNAVPFAVNPLPPHLGLDGISNEIRFVN